MKTAEQGQQIRQGDVLLTPVAELPADAKVRDNQGIRIEGERTGHAHQLVGPVAVAEDGREFVRGGNVLTHQEHEHIATSPEWYEVTVQREHVPEARTDSRRFD